MMKVLGGTLVVVGSAFFLYRLAKGDNLGMIGDKVAGYGSRVKSSFNEGYSSVAT
jgi:hypothetical protein